MLPKNILSIATLASVAAATPAMAQEVLRETYILHRPAIIERTITAPAVIAPTPTQIFLSTPSARIISIPAELPTPGSNYRARLSHLLEHINFGLAKGFITSGQAASLQAEHNRVAGIESSLRADGRISHEDAAAIEKELTRLSLVITETFNSRMIGGTGTTM